MCHGRAWLERCEEICNQVINNFESTKNAWVRIFQGYNRREIREVIKMEQLAAEGDKGGMGDALMDLEAGKESKEDKEKRMRAIFEKYDDDGGGTVDAEELVAVFEDMGIDVPDEDEMADLLQEFSGGADEVEFEQFCDIVDALESDDNAKMKRIFDKRRAAWLRAPSARVEKGLCLAQF